MALPTYDKLYNSILEVLADGKIHNSEETISYCAKVFKLTDEEKKQLLKSGKQTVIANRVGWARTYLKKAGLIKATSKGHYQITPEGERALKGHITIDNEYLANYKSFQKFISVTENDNVPNENSENQLEDSKTPLEIMDVAFNGLNEQLADDLLMNIMEKDPSFFEHLVIDLLEKMGYGNEIENPGEVTGKTGDEGIDGIIREDALGFNKIYVQAKKWNSSHSVGEPEIQQFAGALLGRGATKGLFITTSHFTKNAISYVEKHMAAQIILVDGEKLTSLMIKYGLGVSTIHTYEIKRVDSDYFKENDE